MSFNSSEQTDNLQEQLKNYERLLDISRQLNSTLEHRTLLQHIIDAVVEIIHTEAASIMLIDPSTGELRFEISSNMNPHMMENIIVPMEGSIAGWIATHGEPRVIQDIQNEPGHFQNVDNTIEFTTRNLLGVPLRTHKKVIGVLQAVNKQTGEKFSEQDINTLTILASQAGIAIENARLFRQSDFIAEMVHELRTPLAALKASTALLFRPELPEVKRTEIYELLQGETDRLSRLTTEFLDLAQLESGRTRLEIKSFEIHKLLRESADVVRPQADEKNITIDIQEGELSLEGDRGKLKQVFLNLLTNGVKYNRSDGNISIAVSKGTQNVQISVTDTGYGISKVDQSQMFQKFFRVKDTADKAQGTGLGLAITKHIIEAHNGDIWLESEVGVGSTFFVLLPLTQQ